MEHANSSDAVTFATSLGMLNNDCLMEIFQFLQPIDYLNLAKTNCRLRAIADSTGKFKEIEIEANYGSYETESDDQLADTLSMVGNRISSLKLHLFDTKKAEEACSILEMINQNCKQLKNLTVKGNFRQSGLTALKTCIANNPGIENMFLQNSRKNNDYLLLLLLLPELKSLGICTDNRVNPLHLKNLNQLTRLTIFFCPNTNEVLSELAKKGMLEELHIWNGNDEDTFNTIKSFEKLQILSVHDSSNSSRNSFPKATILPSKLKYFHLGRIKMNREALLWIIRQLTFLKELVLDHCLNTNMNIVWSDDGDISNQWHRIAEELRDELNQRILTIHFSPRNKDGTFPRDSVKKCLYGSSHLKVLNYTEEELRAYLHTFFGLKTEMPAENTWRIKI